MTVTRALVFTILGVLFLCALEVFGDTLYEAIITDLSGWTVVTAGTTVVAGSFGTSCPYLGSGDCIRLRRIAEMYLNTSISTIDYQNIVLLFSIYVTGLDVSDIEYCRIQYSVGDQTTSWIDFSPAVELGNGNYNVSNVTSFPAIAEDNVGINIRVVMDANHVSDQCFLNYIYIFADPITKSPTTEPTVQPTIGPTLQPTSNPTMEPSLTTLQPTGMYITYLLLLFFTVLIETL